ncbi:shikimate kinase, partial [Vibrio sp. 10N.222.52.B7]
MKSKKILVMGVSGCGKSLIGSRIAQALELQFFDGDDFHPQSNV